VIYHILEPPFREGVQPPQLLVAAAKHAMLHVAGYPDDRASAHCMSDAAYFHLAAAVEDKVELGLGVAMQCE